MIQLFACVVVIVCLAGNTCAHGQVQQILPLDTRVDSPAPAFPNEVRLFVVPVGTSEERVEVVIRATVETLGEIYIGGCGNALPNSTRYDWVLAWTVAGLPSPPDGVSVSVSSKTLYLSASSLPPLDPSCDTYHLALYGLGEVVLSAQVENRGLVAAHGGRVEVSTETGAQDDALLVSWPGPHNIRFPDYEATVLLLDVSVNVSRPSTSVADMLSLVSSLTMEQALPTRTVVGDAGTPESSHDGFYTQSVAHVAPGVYVVNVRLSSLIDDSSLLLTPTLMVQRPTGRSRSVQIALAILVPAGFFLGILFCFCVLHNARPAHLGRGGAHTLDGGDTRGCYARLAGWCRRRRRAEDERIAWKFEVDFPAGPDVVAAAALPRHPGGAGAGMGVGVGAGVGTGLGTGGEPDEGGVVHASYRFLPAADVGRPGVFPVFVQEHSEEGSSMDPPV